MILVRACVHTLVRGARGSRIFITNLPDEARKRMSSIISTGGRGGGGGGGGGGGLASFSSLQKHVVVNESFLDRPAYLHGSFYMFSGQVSEEQVQDLLVQAGEVISVQA